MTLNTDRIATAVRDLCNECRLSVDPKQRGPILLSRFFEERSIAHVALPELAQGKVVAFLREQGVSIAEIGEPDVPLAGFIFVAGRIGWAFVNADDPLARRRFTAAHELGHFQLHQVMMSSRYIADTKEAIQEDAGASEIEQMEREANRFAVELLMPAEVCRARAAELQRQHGCCPRGVLVYRLAAELLVSREAMSYRLKALGVGDA